MSSIPTTPSAARGAQTALVRELQHVAELHADRRVNPAFAGALDRLAQWQAKRLRATYSDLAQQPRYVGAIEFFQADLYGSGDFAQRDADLARVVPVMVRMLPVRVIDTIAQAVELNVLSQECDRALLARLPRVDAPFSVAEYCQAFRSMGQRPSRERQIELIVEIGSALDIFVTKPLIHGALVMMRQPARLAGLGALHDFLERGFNAFRHMGGAREFLDTIAAREKALLDAVYGGDDAPFADPLGAPAASVAATR